MPIWAEEISGTKWFMGTVSFVEYADTWPGSAWKCLKVTWDDPGHVKDVERVSPWSVELDHSSGIVPENLISFSTPKRQRIGDNPKFSSISVSREKRVISQNPESTQNVSGTLGASRFMLFGKEISMSAIVLSSTGTNSGRKRNFFKWK
ncbi:hypothetical protein KSP40_PGU018729 [Platanthera guangdongensis]|uniref:Auxin response factor domain-containing protein n=1 Tax=Platanthera guangdongensis TaxID=2320717 RepID=A0ABR2MIQ7_9ASPA